jgi:hypothetical protein
MFFQDAFLETLCLALYVDCVRKWSLRDPVAAKMGPQIDQVVIKLLHFQFPVLAFFPTRETLKH